MKWLFEDAPGWVTTLAILAVVILWAAILEAVVGLDTLRRLLGWTMGA